MALKLFENIDGSQDDTKDKLEIDHEFARRYEHNKSREDLQRLEELKKKGLVADSLSNTSDSSDSDEDDYNTKLVDPKNDLEFLNALIRVKNQDHTYKSGKLKLFELESDSDDGNGGEERIKKEKPLYIKDVVAMHLMEEGPEFEENEDGKLPEGFKSYSQEQEELRKAVLDAAEEAVAGDDGGDFFKLKENKRRLDEGEDNEIKKKADEYFGEEEKLDGNEKFLKKFFTEKLYAMKGNDDQGLKMELDEEDSFGVSEDEEYLERQEDYEREFNFRFEENAGDRVMGHSRFVEGSVRKKTSARYLQRKSKEERMALAEFERKEELKHLKNMKKKELNEKLRKIRETAGIVEENFCALDVDDLDDDFDPNTYDKKMKKAFGDNYYQAEDIDPHFGSDNDDGDLEKPNFDKEDELLGLPKDWDEVHGSSDGFLATRRRQSEHEIYHQEQLQAKEEVASEVGKWLDEYYKLDYEDTIGDLKTRFKYKSVNPKRYGLSTEEVLLMDDSELNQYVSLKKLTPYRENEWKVPRIKTYNLKRRNKALTHEEEMNLQNSGKKSQRDGRKSTMEITVAQMGKVQSDQSHSDQINQGRGSRRKRCYAELKLSRSRLMAYGKISSKSKKK